MVCGKLSEEQGAKQAASGDQPGRCGQPEASMAPTAAGPVSLGGDSAFGAGETQQ